MTERPHYRSKTSIRNKVQFIFNDGPELPKAAREAIQLANIPDTTFGSATLACYSIDAQQPPVDDAPDIATHAESEEA